MVDSTDADKRAKGKPVIGGFLVSTPQGAAPRARYLLRNRDRLEEMGRKAQQCSCVRIS